MDAFMLLGGFLAGGVAGFILANYFLHSTSVSPAELEKTRQLATAMQAKCEAAEKQCGDIKKEREKLQHELTDARADAAALQARQELLEQRMAEHQQELEGMRVQLAQQFENLAHKIFEQSSSRFNEQSKNTLDTVLSPLKERLNEFQKKVDDAFGTQAKEQFSLKEQIKHIVDTNEKMRMQTESLAKALKGDVKVQGNWGEVMLERILEEAGLRRGLEYSVQGVDLGLKHVEDGSAQKPDVIVKLPDEKHIIIDSKVSLTHYERYCSENAEDAKPIHLRQYLASIRAHVNGLAQRRYQDSEKLGTPDFVLLFMPIEGAYSLAVQQDAELHGYAWDKKVVMVCPSTLFATLRTIASLWRMEMQNRNTQEIARQGGELYDKIVGFVEDMQTIRKHIGNAEAAHDAAMKKLSDGRGSALRRVEELKKLGAKASKTLPRELLEDAEETTAEILPLVS